MENIFFVRMSSTISIDWAALSIRLVIGLSLLPYVITKLKDWKTPPEKFPTVFGMTPQTSFYLAMAAETFAFIGRIFGFCTRLASLVGACNMGVATWKVHGKDWSANAMPYFFGFIAIFLLVPAHFRWIIYFGKFLALGVSFNVGLDASGVSQIQNNR